MTFLLKTIGALFKIIFIMTTHKFKGSIVKRHKKTNLKKIGFSRSSN